MRASDPDDFKFLYATWRMGKLPFHINVDGESPEAFVEALGRYIALRFQLMFTLIAKPPSREVMPVGVVFGVVPVYGKRIAWVGDFTWFPWASRRNRLECAVHFANQMRREWVVVGFASQGPAAELAERCCRYGVSRRVGTLFDLDDKGNAGPVSVFQTRRPMKG